MDKTTPTLIEWNRLYQAASRVKEMAPWEWMSETDIFGVKNPETGETGFISVMGALGEHFCVAVYLGPKGLHGFWVFHELGVDAPAEMLIEIPHLQGSFEDRNTLSKRDRDLIKELGLKFRGRNEWPWFRSFRPGFFPWYLEAWEARFLTTALEQTANVAPRFKENPSMLMPAESDADSYLVRVPQEKEGRLVWEDQVETVPPVEPESLMLRMDVDVLEALKRLPLSPVHFEMDYYMFPAPIEEKGLRPYFAYSLLIVDGDNGLVLGHELLQPKTTLEALWELVPLTIVHQLAQLGVVPRTISVQSGLLYELLQTLVEELGFEVTLTPTLPALNEAKDFMHQRFS